MSIQVKAWCFGVAAQELRSSWGHGKTFVQENHDELHIASPTRENHAEVDIVGPKRENHAEVDIVGSTRENHAEVDIVSPTRENHAEVYIVGPTRENQVIGYSINEFTGSWSWASTCLCTPLIRSYITIACNLPASFCDYLIRFNLEQKSSPCF